MHSFTIAICILFDGDGTPTDRKNDDNHKATKDTESKNFYWRYFESLRLRGDNLCIVWWSASRLKIVLHNQ